jgi:predicted transcriptional regulator
MSDDEAQSHIDLAADIVAAYVSNNSVTAADLPALIGTVHSALQSAAAGPEVAKAPTAEPAVPIKKSITPDYLISLEDGKRYKSMKRHLTRLGITPEQYRAKWGLPRDYPMVAPNYAKQRSELALALGLGRKRTGIEAAPARRGRKKAADAG